MRWWRKKWKELHTWVIVRVFMPLAEFWLWFPFIMPTPWSFCCDIQIPSVFHLLRLRVNELIWPRRVWIRINSRRNKNNNSSSNICFPGGSDGKESPCQCRRHRRPEFDLVIFVKEYVKAVYCHPAYLTYMQSTSCEMLGWKKHKLESRLPGEISITSDMQMTPPLWQKAKKNWRISWWKWKRRVKKLA